MSDDRLVADGQQWETLERMAGDDPDGLPYPPDIADRLEKWIDESGNLLLVEALMAAAMEGKVVEFDFEAGKIRVLDEEPET